MEKKYVFNLTIQEGQLIMAALKKFPMETVEGLVVNLDKQFAAQVEADNAAAQVPTPANDVVTPVAPKRGRKPAATV